LQQYLAALIAAQNRDPELADTVAAVAVERLVLSQKVDRLLPTIAVILQCAAARADRKEALSTLARRLENLAFVAPARCGPGWIGRLCCTAVAPDQAMR
jgi:hypothetical protein